MTVFMVVAKDPNTELESAVSRAYPEKHFRFSDRAWFVSATGTPRSVSEKIGVQKGGFSGVVVIPIGGSYYGIASTALWDWIRVEVEGSTDG